MKQYIRIFTLFILCFAGMHNEAWAAKVTYHILTLPIDNDIYHMVDAADGYRLEAVKVVVDNQTTVELPAHYKSPLAENFKYYLPADITVGGSAISLYTTNTATKGKLYQVNGEDTPEDDSDDATPVAEGTVIAGTSAEYYVVYTYNESNTIAKLDGSVRYNIGTMNKDKGVYKDKGFISLNRGRNNRPAVVPTGNVNPEMLANEDFSYIETPGAGISPYWSDGNNKNKKEDTGSQFFFMFQFEGLDPYNIIIVNAYNKNTTFIEKNEDGDNKNFVYKWYKGGQLFSAGTANAFIASDIHKRYLKLYDSSSPNPTELIEGTDYETKNGYFRSQTKTVWGSYAILRNFDNTGYVFMGTRTVNESGATPNTPYYLKEANNCNNLVLNQVTAENASNNLSIKGIYPIEKVTFKIPTPFYKVTASEDHIVSVSDWVSKHTVDNDPIETKYLPAALRRKYCNFTGKFYKDAACTEEITKFSEATKDPTEGYQVYIGYEVSASIPFKAITPAATYSASTWAGATWYELTDEGSTEEYGRKLKYDGTNFKNNGAAGSYEKESEFAFIGDPYELRVVYRNATSGATPYFVGAAGTPPTTGTLLTASTSETAGYLWEMPVDAVDGSFLLQKYKGEGCWDWDAGQPTGSVTYQSDLAHSAGKDAQTITFTVSGLDGSKYIKVTTGGTDAAQIVSVTPTANTVVKETGTSATVTVKLAANTSGANKTMTVTIQEYNNNDGTGASGTASVITITQGTSSASFAGNTVEYSTSNSTRIIVLELPTRNFTYNIVDKAGNIAAKATASQAIYSPLSVASIPSIIVSPFILDETITFYTTYGETGRGSLSSQITELPAGNAVSSTNVYVKYTTTRLVNKPAKLNEDQEFNVKLNGHYIYYDKTNHILKTNDSPSDSELSSSSYLWKLRNRDPYAMLIDNLGAREDLSVTGTESVTVYDDNGGTTTESRQKGAWVKLATTLGNDVGLVFDTDRANAQRFIAKASVATGVYEVMVATDAADASTTYYNIGCPEDNSVKIYSNSTYVHGEEELKFILNQNVTFTYHLIDKAKHELLTVESKNLELALPAEYQSPLVGTYNFYSTDQMTIDTSKDPDEYTPTNPAVKLSTIADLDAQFPGGVESSSSSEYTDALSDYKHAIGNEADIADEAKKLTTTGYHYYNVNSGTSYKKVNITRAYRGTDIYVTYDVNDLIGFNNTGKVNDHPYLLKFLEPYADGYYLEDGNDKLTTSKIQAVYPYCNGDGNLNIYGTAMRDEQMNGGSSTRPRWVWFFESANSDPYHVRIHSRSTISYNSVSNPTYLETKAVHFNQSATNVQTVITGGSLPGIASTNPTEYMVLGTEGAYKLLTTQPVEADFNGDGDTSDEGENERRTVNSFEQYWKTYNMVKLHVLGVSSSTDEYSEDESTWVVPTTGDYRTTLSARGWHSYDVYANATRWNGYNNKTDGHEKKVVEKLEHWFQTFNMGNGTFDIESADIPPVLVLLDQHGWEIMRRPLPEAHYPEGEEEIAALRVYDSPLVDKYYFYSNATKASGCHKYTLRLDDKGKERDQIKVNGERYSSTSLGDLPPASATGVKSGGVLNDQFVTYTVKEEYTGNYAYNLTYTGDKDAGYTITSETGTSQPYLVLQNSRFYKTQNSKSDNTSYFSKPIIEHTNPEGGNVYDLIVAPHNHGVNNDNIIDGSGNFIGNIFWYVKPNMNIDEEMGIKWGTANSGAEPLSENATKVTYKDKSGFDPYNMQLQLVNNNDGTSADKYLTTHMTSAHLDNGIMVGDYSGSGGTTKITLEDPFTAYSPTTDKGSEGYDHTNLQISNQTFMAVSDANGNMQLMPRFDHTKRISLANVSPWETQLANPEDHAKASLDDNSSMGPQTTFFVRPQRFIYHIIDNKGREALRYTRGGDNYPAITDHFKSPLATDFTYYKGLAVYDDPVASSVSEWGPAAAEFKRSVTSEALMNSQINLLPEAGTYYYQIGSRGVFTYKKVTVNKGLLEQEITDSYAAASEDGDLQGVENDIYVRYNYDEDADHDADRILEGKWFTVKLADKDLQANGTLVVPTGETQGTGVNLYADDDEFPTKPETIDADDKKWQWKFRTAPADPSSDYYELPDPYAIQLFNRESNYTTNPSLEPSPMAVGIKVPNANDGADRFALLSHPSGGYALVVAKAYGSAPYLFLNGADMTKPDAVPPVAATTYPENRQKLTVADAEAYATAKAALTADGEYYYKYSNGGEPETFTYKKVIVTSGTPDEGTTITSSEWEAGDTYSFTYKSNAISPGAQLLLEDDIDYNFTYRVINNANKLAITAEQNNAEASSHDFFPYLPESAQTPLLNMDDYVYYGFATNPGGDTYIVIQPTKLYTLYGLYDDVVYVRYKAYDVDKTSFKVPNKRNSTGTGQVERDSESHDASMNISGGLPYNIIWYNDNMMTSTDGTSISGGGSQSLSGNQNYVWYFTGGDPYALKIRHKKDGKYVNGTTTLESDAADAMQFMLLKKDDYDYGILQVTGTTGANAGKKLTGYGGALTADSSTDPTKFIIFGLSVHDLIYHLIINTTNQHTIIPYRSGDENTYTTESVISATDTLWIRGTTQRNLTDETSGIAGDKYQVGSTISWGSENHIYSHDAGTVSIGDDLWVPNVFYRPNCTFDFYIEGIYSQDGSTSQTALDNRFKGLKLKKLMSDSELIDKTVVVNIVYSFNKELTTNSGLDFVTSLNQNLWYTFETPEGATPYLAHYTNAWGLQAMEGRETRFTNDYLWTPLGDVYGFKMYNRYMNKTSGRQDNVMTMDNIAEDERLYMAIPGTSTKKNSEDVIPEDYGIFELIAGDQDGYFRVHPMVNTSDQTQYYVNRDGSNYAVLSTTPSDWTFGLDMTLLEPYHQRAGYVGGLTAAGKTEYENVIKEKDWKIVDLQAVVYNDDNIVHYAPGYYRLHNQPGVSDIDPVRYASGYLHDIEKTAGAGSTPIPMHFYSRAGIGTHFVRDDDENSLTSGFTVTNATQGEIPVDSTEVDPSTIFYFSGNETRDSYGNPTSKIQTQGLYVKGNQTDDNHGDAVMTATEGQATTFSVMDIGGAVLLIHDGSAPATRKYLNFSQSYTVSGDNKIYDLKYFHNAPTDDAKWCMQPVQKTATKGNGEMHLSIKINNGGDGYYYTTFYAPFDVALPADAGGKTYNAYICKKWYDEGVNPSAVPACTVNETDYAEGKFVPAGTPVIIRVKDESGYLKVTLPTNTPSESPVAGNIFSGEYLEQLLALDASHDVYTLGLPFTSDVSKDGDYDESGDISAPKPEQAKSGVGFYINATRNKEIGPLKSAWTRNNRYVLHNKIYYRAPGGGGGSAKARKMSSMPQFVPVIFDDELEEEFQDEEQGQQMQEYGDGVYDLSGRKVANEEQVQDGTWRQRLSPGIYIVQGKKVKI